MKDLDLDGAGSPPQSSLILRLADVREEGTLLRSMPHGMAFDGMAVTVWLYRLGVEGKTDADIRVFPVTDGLMRAWGWTAEGLLGAARENMFRRLPPVLWPLGQLMRSGQEGSLRDAAGRILAQAFPGQPPDSLGEAADALADQLCARMERDGGLPPMWVLGNRLWLFGASGLLNQEALSSFAAANGSFYIFPSSIHEAVLMPAAGAPGEDALREMALRSNRIARESGSFLSSRLYFFDADRQRILLCDR